MSPGLAGRRNVAGWKKISQFVGFTPLFIVFLFYWHETLLIEYEGQFGYGQVEDYGLPAEMMELFRSYDSDANGYIDPYEFSFLQENLEQEGMLQLDLNYSTFEYVDEEIGIGKEAVVLQAEMEPIVTSTMTKFDKAEDDYIFGSPEKLLPGLLQWQSAHTPSQVYGARNFRAFLPPADDWPIGKTYYIVEDKNQFTPMNRYHPPRPPAENYLLYNILAQLHPNIFLVTRFGPKGTVGTVRARTTEVLDIIFRVHAEYQLNSHPDYPFWFTPAQFSGRLITDYNSHHIYHFELELPTDHQLNIDMEWITGARSNEVDIGYVPLMRVFSASPSKCDNQSSNETYNVSSIAWNQEISMHEALQEIERTMYPFKKVKYFPFLEAVSLALKEVKLIHLIILWGVLDDQSC